LIIGGNKLPTKGVMIMGKIRYIEDEPDAGFIIQLFKKVLSREEIEELKESENDIPTILETVKNNPYFSIYVDFSEALMFFLYDLKKDDLLIVDRNLYGSGLMYDLSSLPENSELTSFDNRFIKREGDYLFHIARHKDFDFHNRFFMFTGNDDDIRQASDMEFNVTEKFQKNNVIIKNSKVKNRLSEIIDSNFQIQIENKNYLDILNSKMCFLQMNETDQREQKKTSAVEEFLYILSHEKTDDQTVMKSVMGKIRVMAENICHYVAVAKNAPSDVFDKRFPDQFRYRPFINWLVKKNYRNQYYLDNEEWFDLVDYLIKLIKLKTRNLIELDHKDLKKMKSELNSMLERIVTHLKAWEEVKDKKNEIDLTALEKWLNERRKKSYIHHTNIVIEQYLYLLTNIPSDISQHDCFFKEKGFEPTNNTLSCLISALKEIILWYNQIMTEGPF